MELLSPPLRCCGYIFAHSMTYACGTAEREMLEPYCLAMVLCDSVHRDAATGKFTLLGTFSILFAQEFPTLAQFSVYFAVTDGIGTMPIRLRIVDAEFGITESEEQAPDIVIEMEQEVKFDDPLAVNEIAMGLQVPIPKPGLYHCELLVNGVVLMSRRMLAAKPEANEGGSDE